jgi:hypothetical protein
MEHRTLMTATIEAERIFIKVHLQVLGADVAVDAPNAVLRQAPEAFQRVRVRVAIDVYLRGMMDALVFVSHPLQLLVSGSFVCEHSRRGQHMSFNQREDGRLSGVGYHLCDDSPLAFYRTPNSSFAYCAATRPEFLIRVLVAFLSAVEAFVCLYFARQRLIITFQHLADQMEHSPSGLVGNANLTTQLLGRDAATSRGHDVYGVKPELQRGCGILEDSSLHRMLMASAILTSIGRALSIAMMLRNLLAFRTEDTVGIVAFNQPFQTSSIIGKLPLELHERVGAIRRSASDWLVAIRFAHELTVAQGSTAVKGIHTLENTYEYFMHCWGNLISQKNDTRQAWFDKNFPDQSLTPELVDDFRQQTMNAAFAAKNALMIVLKLLAFQVPKLGV